jgi:transposase
LWLKPLKSWAEVGSSPKIVGCSQPGINCSLCMAIDYNVGILKYQLLTGSFNSGTFIDFIDGLVKEIASSKSQNAVIIMDNARIHNPELVKDKCGNICEHKFLSPYSPMFNPIENVFGTIKMHVRRLLGSQEYADKVKSGLFYFICSF